MAVVISGLVTVGLAALLSYLLVALIMVLSKPQRTDEAGNPVLVLPRFYGVTGGLAVLGSITLLLWEWWRHGAAAALDGPLLALLFFAAPGLYLVLSTYVQRVTLTPTGIVHRSMLGRVRYLPWNQLQGARFSATSLLLTLTAGRQRVQCHAHLLGFELLVAAVTQQLPQTPEELGIR